MKPKPGKLDMEAVARLLGVSKTTVHYAIRNTGRLSDETRKRVLKLVEAKGYRPNGLARSFRRQRIVLEPTLIVRESSGASQPG